jgi:hypothetical protein
MKLFSNWLLELLKLEAIINSTSSGQLPEEVLLLQTTLKITPQIHYIEVVDDELVDIDAVLIGLVLPQPTMMTRLMMEKLLWIKGHKIYSKNDFKQKIESKPISFKLTLFFCQVKSLKYVATSIQALLRCLLLS